MEHRSGQLSTITGLDILHISDLHFGAHDDALSANLLDLVKADPPDVIVCTGDLADSPDKDLLRAAQEYLSKLSRFCRLSPGLLVAPGNHDYRVKGWLTKSLRSYWSPLSPFEEIFDGKCYPSSHYFEDQGVWIFRFDSASKGGAGGGGEIAEEEIARFHAECARLKREASGFERAFKIAAVHHHPVPVNWDYDFRTRWLTMGNAGAFLSMLLSQGVDVVLHGHEHLQCRSRIWSTLGSSDRELAIISLGSTLCRVKNPERNWFARIQVTKQGSATASFHSSVNKVFAPDTAIPPMILRPDAARLNFESMSQREGYSYREVAVAMVLLDEGDAWGSVEFKGYRSTSDSVSRNSRHHLKGLNSADGYMDCFECGGDASPRRVQEGALADLVFNPPMAKEKESNYWYRSWWVNAFAMDRAEFRYLYPAQHDSADGLEFSAHVIADPIRMLQVTVQFPDGLTPDGQPGIRVTRPVKDQPPRNWPREVAQESAIRAAHGVSFYEAARTAIARIPFPEPGLAYGIEWKVPASRPYGDGSRTKNGLDLIAMQRLWAAGITPSQRGAVEMLTAKVLVAAREAMMGRWKGHAEAGFCYFDSETGFLRFLGAVEGFDPPSPVDRSAITFPYGRGIAGRSLKTNAPRWYIREGQQYIREPGYYEPIQGQTPHEVVLCLPLRCPQSPLDPYGVMCIGSTRVNCPMSLRMEIPTVSAFQEEIQDLMFSELLTIFEV